jgi:TPR repeat protein
VKSVAVLLLLLAFAACSPQMSRQVKDGQTVEAANKSQTPKDEGGAKAAVFDHPAHAQILLSSCDKGDLRSCSTIVKVAYGHPGGEPYLQAVVDSLGQHCSASVPEACLRLGRMYNKGVGVTQDRPRAITLFESGCTTGEAQACADAAYAHRKGHGKAPDYGRAATFAKRGCDAGNRYACRELGLLTAEGKGVPRDKTQAADFMEQACQDDDYVACSWLAMNVTAPAGNGVRTLVLLKKSCHGGLASPCHALAKAHHRGLHGLVPNPIQAKLRYQQACQAGIPEACATAATLD